MKNDVAMRARRIHLLVSRFSNPYLAVAGFSRSLNELMARGLIPHPAMIKPTAATALVSSAFSYPGSRVATVLRLFRVFTANR
jgi:hypothetical protein